MVEKQTLLLDMYGVIIKESKGNFIPYTYAHFDKKEHSRLTRAFREEDLFTKAGNGELSSDEFLSRLGFSNPTQTIQDYLQNFLTLDEDFLWFAETFAEIYDFILLSNDVKEWSRYLLKLHGIARYFKTCIISGEAKLRKPDSRIFSYALSQASLKPEACLFVDNCVQNLHAAQKLGIRTVLFNRDHVAYSGETVNHFRELERYL